MKSLDIVVNGLLRMKMLKQSPILMILSQLSGGCGRRYFYEHLVFLVSDCSNTTTFEK